MSANINFNELTPAEAERLTLLMEECAEVIQIICKIQRHGYFSHHPNQPHITNNLLLAEEIGHVLAAKCLLVEYADIDALAISHSQEKKTLGYRAKKYLHHQ